MTAVLPDFSVTITQRRWALCAGPDPGAVPFRIALGQTPGECDGGVGGAGALAYPDNTHFYLQQPEILLQARVPQKKGDGVDGNGPEEIVRALHEWEQRRVIGASYSMAVLESIIAGK